MTRPPRWMVAAFALLSLSILGPLLGPGTLLLVDSPIALNQDPWAFLSGQTTVSTSVFGATAASAPYAILLDGLGRIVGSDVAQKAYLFLLFFLAAWGAARLPGLAGAGRWYAGVFYAVNPFIYVRFLAGQWGVVLGYALLPFALTAWLRLLQAPSWRLATRVALLATAVALAQVHALVLLVLVCAACTRGGLVRAARWAGSVGLLFAALNAYWLIPAALDAARSGAVAGRFDAADFEAYKPRPTSPLGVAYDVASLHGFWRGRRAGYRFVHDVLPGSWLLFVAIAGLAVHGVRRGIGDPWAMGLAVVAALSFVLALGAATAPTAALARALWELVPGYSAFRDSQKFSGLLALAYAYFGGRAVQSIRLAYAASVLPVLFTLPLFGLAGQARPTAFPPEWHEARDVLRQDEGDHDVLFLPWHMYMSYGWVPNRDNTLAPLGPMFFGPAVQAADNIEAGKGTKSQSLDPRSRYFESLIGEFQRRRGLQNFGSLLALANVRYVILVEEVDADLYDFLFAQDDLEIALRRPGIVLLRNRHPHARTYAVDGLGPEDVPALVEAAQHGDPMPRVVPGRHTVFIPRHGTTAAVWRQAGKPPGQLFLGFAPVFDGNANDPITFPRTRHARTFEGVALLVLIGWLVGEARGRRRNVVAGRAPATTE